MKQKTLILAFAVFGLIACNNSSRHTNTANTAFTVDTMATQTIADNDTIIYDYFTFPADSTFSTKVLKVGSFHGDEVWENANQSKWIGLFNGSDGYYLKWTKIKMTNVNDPVLDEDENEKTGWEVQVENNDTCLILIEPFPILTERPIQSLSLTKNYIYPQDTIEFIYLGISYKIFATGGKKKTDNDTEWFDVWNYKLYITTSINGQIHKSLLVAKPNFEDQMINLIFAGDIDGDGILDLIIDVSRHYNETSPTIYLSRPADNGEVVKPIGGHTSVGC